MHKTINLSTAIKTTEIETKTNVHNWQQLVMWDYYTKSIDVSWNYILKNTQSAIKDKK